VSLYEFLAVSLYPGYNRYKATKIATNLLRALDGNFIDLFTAAIHPHMQVRGIAFVKVCEIKTTFELGNKTKDNLVKHPLPYMKYLKQEEFRALLLDGENRLICHCRISLFS
jgi:DNA repair protein RadC